MHLLSAPEWYVEEAGNGEEAHRMFRACALLRKFRRPSPRLILHTTMLLAVVQQLSCLNSRSKKVIDDRYVAVYGRQVCSSKRAQTTTD